MTFNSEEEELERIFAEVSDEEEHAELVSTDAVPQVPRLGRLRNWWCTPKPAKPTETLEDQTALGLIPQLDFQRQGSELKGSPQAQNTTYEAEASSEPIVHEVAPSSWRIVNWWKGTGQAVRKSASETEYRASELAMLRQNHSAPELTALVPAQEQDDLVVFQNDLASSHSSRGASPERTVCDMPPTLHLRESHLRVFSPRGIVKRALSDSNLVASEEESLNIRTAKDDLHADPVLTPPRRRYGWLNTFRRKLDTVDALSDLDNSTSTPTMLSDSHESAVAGLSPRSPRRGTTQPSCSVTSAPEVTGSNDGVSDIAVCQPPVFTGKVDTPPPSSRSEKDVMEVDPSVAEFRTPDLESKDDAPESTSPVKAVLSYFRKR